MPFVRSPFGSERDGEAGPAAGRRPSPVSEPRAFSLVAVAATLLGYVCALARLALENGALRVCTRSAGRAERLEVLSVAPPAGWVRLQRDLL